MDSQMQDLHSCSKRALHAVTVTNSYRAPPYVIAQNAEQEPEIPHASLFAGLDEDGILKSSTGTHSRQTSQNFSYRNREKGDNGGHHHNTSISHTQEHHLPTAAQCAVHLELLEAIFALQHRVLASNALDRTFGLRPDRKRVYFSALRRAVYVRDHRNDAAFAERRKVKWEFFVQAAAARFEAWWGEKCDSVPDRGQGTKHRTGCIAHANLPPLDVLMIWHSFLLNPGMYEARCADAGTLRLLDIPFPWASVHHAIKSRDRTFTLHHSAASNFTLNTGYDADLLAFLSSEDMANSINKDNFKLGHSLDSNAGLRRLQNALYTDFATILTAAFARQADFTTKMALQHLWLRSPSASYTLAQAASRYPKFLALFRLHPRTLLVPTLDIDLAWHTHQLSPAAYRVATVDLCGQFVDHDAGLAKEVLAGGWETTVRLWEARWGSAYKICMCWDCEGLSAELEKSGDGDGDGDVDVEKLVEKVKGDVAFYRAVEIARRKGGKLPFRASSG